MNKVTYLVQTALMYVTYIMGQLVCNSTFSEFPNVVGGAPASGRAYYFQNACRFWYKFSGRKAFKVGPSLENNDKILNKPT